MSGENDYEIHVGITGLQESIAQLEAYEQKLASLGHNSSQANPAIAAVAELKAAAMQVEATINQLVGNMSERLSSGFKFGGSEGLTAEAVRVFEPFMAKAREAREVVDKTFSGNHQMRVEVNADLTALTESLARATRMTVNQSRSALQSAAAAGGLSESEARQALGNAGGLNSALNAAMRRAETAERMVTVYRGSNEPFDPSRVNGEGLRVTQERAYAEQNGGDKYLYSTQIPASRFQTSEFTGDVIPHTMLTSADLERYPLQPVAVPASTTVRTDGSFVDSLTLRAQEAERQRKAMEGGWTEPARSYAISEDAPVARARAKEEADAKVAATALALAAQEERERLASLAATQAKEAEAKAARTLADAKENEARRAEAAGPPPGLHGAGGGGEEPPKPPVSTGGAADDEFFSGGTSRHLHPDEGPGLPSVDQAVMLTKLGYGARTGTGDNAGFLLPDFAGPGQSPFFDLIRGTHDKETGITSPDEIRRILDPASVQQAQARLPDGEPTTEAGRRRQQEEQAASLNRLIIAQNKEAVALLESEQLLKKQGSNFSLSPSGDYVRRTGQLAGTVVAEGDSTYYQDLAAARLETIRSAKTEAADAKKAERLNQSSSIGGAAWGGFTGKGFDNPGEGVLPSLAGTAGVLARYALDGAAFGAVAVGMKTVLTSTEEYQKALLELDEATKATGAGQISLNGAFDEGAKFGIAQAEAITLGTAGIRNYAQEIKDGANATDVFNESVKQAGIAATITGQKVAEAQKQLLAITNQFNLGSQGQGQVNDAILAASQHFNASPTDVMKGVEQNGDLANVAGFDVNRIAATVAAVSGEGASTAGLSRLLARGGNAQFQGALSSLGVTNTGNVAAELDAAGVAYGNLNNQQKIAFATQAGGARTAADLIAILKNQATINDVVGESYKNAGSAAELSYRMQNSMAGQIKQFFTDLKNLGTDIGKSGVADILGVIFEVLKNGIEIADGVVKAFDSIADRAGPFKGLVTVALELLGVLIALDKVGGGSVMRGFGVVGSSIRAKVPGGGEKEAAAAESDEIPAATKTAASQIGAAGGTLATSLDEAAARIAAASGASAEEIVAASKARAGADAAAIAEIKAATDAQAVADAGKTAETVEATGAQGVADAERTAASLLGGISAGLGAAFSKIFAIASNPATLAAGASLIVDDKVFRNNQNQVKAKNAADEAGSTGGDSTQLAKDATAASKAAAEARHSSAGIIGSFVNALTPRRYAETTGQAASRADATAAELAQEATRQRQVEESYNSRLGAAANFGVSNPDFAKGVTDLQAQGQDASQIAGNEIKFLTDYNLREHQSAAYLSSNQGGVLAGRIADTTTSGLRSSAEDNVKGVGDQSGAHVAASKKLANLSADAQKSLNDAINQSTLDFVQANNLEGKDLSKLPAGTLSTLKRKNIEALQKQLKTLGLSDDNIKALQDDLNREAGGAIGTNAFHVNDAGGKPLNQDQVNSATTAIIAQAKAAGTTAGVNEALNGGVFSDQQGVGLAAQMSLLQQARASLAKAGKPDANLSILDDEINQVQLQIDNATGTHVKAMAKFAEDLLPQGDVLQRLQLQLQAAQTALQTDKGQAALDDQGIIAQTGFQIQTKTKVTDPMAAEALTLDPRSAVSASKLAMDTANADYKLAQDQHLETGTLNQKKEAARQAALAYAQAKQQDAAAEEAGNVLLGDKVGELKAKYDGLIAQSQNQVGGAKAQSLREAQQAYVDQQNAAADVTNSQGLAAIDPRKKRDMLLHQLDVLGSKTYAPGDITGMNQNMTDQRNLFLQLHDLDRARADAAEEASVFPGDALGEAKSKLDAASRNLKAQIPGETEFYNAQKQYREARLAYAAEVDHASNLTNELANDRTNPVFNAAEATREARQKLARDTAAGAPKDVLQSDTIDLQAKQQAGQKTAFDQELQMHQTANSLGQESLASYLGYLHNKDKVLRSEIAGMKKSSEGYQQRVDELNTIDQAIKSANQTASGQFNLGDIKVPTVYQVRRTLGEGANSDPSIIQPIHTAILNLAQPAVQAAANVDAVTASITKLSAAAAGAGAVTAAPTPVNLTINGADFAKVVAYLNKILGKSATTTRAPTSGRKVA